MRVVIDMQGAQTGSRVRGIGRYTRDLTAALLRSRGRDEIILLFNGTLGESIAPLQAQLERTSGKPLQSIVWHAPGPLQAAQPLNRWRHTVAQLLRADVVRGLAADWFHCSSLFEGFGDSAVTGLREISRHTRVSVTFYDAIPMVYPDAYLARAPRFAEYYLRLAAQLPLAHCVFAISDSACRDACTYMGVARERLINISSGVEASFSPDPTCPQPALADCILYTGGGDERKNLHRLLEAYASLDGALRARHPLVLAGRLSAPDRQMLERKQKRLALSEQEVRFTGYISDEALITLYRHCRLFVFPSSYEGFGLPPLEAIRCGAVTIAGDSSSLREVVTPEEARFDPGDYRAIAAAMTRGLTDEAFRASLQRHQARHAQQFSWERSASRAWLTWRSIEGEVRRYAPEPVPLEGQIAKVQRRWRPGKRLLAQLAYDICRNRRAVAQLGEPSASPRG